jgi:hypothetical protein
LASNLCNLLVVGLPTFEAILLVFAALSKRLYGIFSGNHKVVYFLKEEALHDEIQNNKVEKDH